MENSPNNNEASKNYKIDDIKEKYIDKHLIKKENMVQILSLPPEERTEEHNEIIKTYIFEISNISKKFSLDNIEERDYKEIITNSIDACHYKLIKNIGDMIYNINDEAFYLYIILKGNVRIFNLRKFQKEMNGHTYYEVLINYQKNNENYLLKKTIDENFHIYPVAFNDVKYLDKIMIKLNLMKMETDNDKNVDPDYLEELLKYYGSSLADFNLESYNDVLRKKNEKIEWQNKLLLEQNQEGLLKPFSEYNIFSARMHSNRNKILIQNMLNFISPEICRKYYFFLTEINENLTYYELVEDKIKGDNEYLGDIKNNRYVQRALNSSENLELLQIGSDMYNDFIKREKAKIIDSQITFFLNNFFFENIAREYFIHYYFPLFEAVNFSLDQIIISENQKVEYVYFIKSGIVKLISNRSILENYIIIDLIKNAIKKINNENSSDSEEKENKMNIKDYVFKSDIKLLKKELNIKHQKHLITYQSNQALGYECFYFGINYLYTAIAASKEVKLYKIRTKHLIEILKEKGHNSFKILVKKAEDAMNLFLERFILLNNDLMKYYDRKLLNKNDYIEMEDRIKDKNEIRKVKNKYENIGINLSEENNKKMTNINANDNTYNSERKSFIKKIFKTKLQKIKKNSIKNSEEESKIKSHELFQANKKTSLKYFFKEKTSYPLIINDYKKSTNYLKNKKESIIKNKILQNQSQNSLLLSSNNNLLDKILLRNKKLLSNIFSSISIRKKKPNIESKKIITPQKICKNSTLKNFNKIIKERFSLNKKKFSYKYDFKLDIDNNIKLLKYSIFDYVKTPKVKENKIIKELCIINIKDKKDNI